MSKIVKGAVKSLVIVLILTVLMMSATFAPAGAKPATTDLTTPEGTDYTQITGTLGDAAYIIQIPDNWNGILVVGCPWYQFPVDNLNCHLLYQDDIRNRISEKILDEGFAFACSNYGATGWPITEAIIRTHQLTEYVIGKYGATGKVFLMGGSMGGAVAILTGEKYPELYSGVLDICGAKDFANTVNYCMMVSTMTLDQVKQLMGLPLIPQTDAAASGFQAFLISIMDDAFAETGGNPDSKPQVYAKIDPNQQLDIKIPIISIYGQIDPVCPPNFVIAYHQALAAVGNDDLHRYYIVPGGAHIDLPIFQTVMQRLNELVLWSNSLD